jgi:DNA-binding NarL/FixJ family response regulator
LAPREWEVLLLVSEGLGNKEIEHKLTLSTSSVKHLCESTFSKLSVRNRTEAATLFVSWRNALPAEWPGPDSRIVE